MWFEFRTPGNQTILDTSKFEAELPGNSDVEPHQWWPGATTVFIGWGSPYVVFQLNRLLVETRAPFRYVYVIWPVKSNTSA